MEGFCGEDGGAGARGGGGISSSNEPIIVTSLGSKGFPGTFTCFGKSIGVPGRILIAIGPSLCPNKWSCSLRLMTS
jgi:hypothetical protein